MGKKGLLIVALSLAGLTLTGCFEKKTPTVDGRKVLTAAQYETLMNKMKKEIKEEAKADKKETGADAFANGAMFYQNRDYANAAGEFEKVVSADAKNSRAWYMLGSCYEHTGNIARSQEAFKRSYDIQVAQGYIADVSKTR